MGNNYFFESSKQTAFLRFKKLKFLRIPNSCFQINFFPLSTEIRQDSGYGKFNISKINTGTLTIENST